MRKYIMLSVLMAILPLYACINKDAPSFMFSKMKISGNFPERTKLVVQDKYTAYMVMDSTKMKDAVVFDGIAIYMPPDYNSEYDTTDVVKTDTIQVCKDRHTIVLLNYTERKLLLSTVFTHYGLLWFLKDIRSNDQLDYFSNLFKSIEVK